MRKEYDFSNAELIIPPKDPNKTRICIRINTKTLNWFRQRVREAGGGNYQTMINEALKEFIDRQNIKNKMTNLLKSIGKVSETITLSSGSVPKYDGGVWVYSKGSFLGQHQYVIPSGQADNFGIKKEDDERNQPSLAA
jgi:hypothetical protein